MAGFTPIEMTEVAKVDLRMREAYADFYCPCSTNVSLGGDLGELGSEAPETCLCGRIYRLRLAIEVSDSA